MLLTVGPAPLLLWRRTHPLAAVATTFGVVADADVAGATADAVVEENESARIAGLRASLAILALLATVALFLTRFVPRSPVGRLPAETASGPPGAA